jgi:hypothetical protein
MLWLPPYLIDIFVEFLAHLTQRVGWAIVTTERPSSVVRRKFHPRFFLFLAWRPSWLQVGIIGHNFGRGPSKDHSTKVWFKLAQWFQDHFKSSPLKPLNQIKPNLAGMVPGWVPFKIVSNSPTLHSRWLLLLKQQVTLEEFSMLSFPAPCPFMWMEHHSIGGNTTFLWITKTPINTNFTKILENKHRPTQLLVCTCSSKYIRWTVCYLIK